MKKYSKYKDSDIGFLDQIPKNWYLQKLKFLAIIQNSNVDKKSFENEIKVRLCNYVDVYKNMYINPYLDLMEATATEDEILKFSVREGDVLITKDSEEWNDIAIPAYVEKADENMVCGYHLSHLRPLLNKLYGKYLFFTFMAHDLHSQYEISATGVTRYGIPKSAIDNAIITVPTIEEQIKISNYLTKKIFEIDRLIKAKNLMIELLKEERAAIINQAVTKGINPDAEMKDSGIEWLGEVPKHWVIGKLKYACDIIKDGTHQPPSRVDEGIPLLSVRNIVNGKFINLPDDSKISYSDFETIKRSYQICEGDVLLAIVGATIGKTAIVEDMPPFTIQRSLAYFRPNSRRLISPFLNFFFQSNFFQKNLWLNTSYSAQPGIYLNVLSDFKIPLPPLEEQIEIYKHIGKNVNTIENIISKAEKEISLIEEYRTALINEAVTGRIDIRGKE